MFRTMRRKKQEMSRDRCREVLERGTSGVLAVLGDEGYPYAVPLSYVYKVSNIYFHCAKSGHKTDAIAKNNKVSFCVIDQDAVIPEEYTTNYRSVIVFGKTRILEGEEKEKALLELILKYVPGGEEKHREVMDKELSGVCVLELSVEHMTGKEGRNIAREQRFAIDL